MVSINNNKNINIDLYPELNYRVVCQRFQGEAGALP